MTSNYFNNQILATCLLFSAFFASVSLHKIVTLNINLIKLLFYSYFQLKGYNYNVVSPTLNKLGQLYNVSLPEISLFYTFRSSGYLASAPIGLILGQFLDRNFILMINLLLLSITLFLIPLCKVLLYNSTTMAIVTMYMTSSINGISSGIIEAIANVWLLEIWPSEKTTPFMQGLHFSFAIGCAVAPMVVAANFVAKKFIFIPYGVGSFFISLPILMSIILLMKQRVIKKTNSKSTSISTKRNNNENISFKLLINYLMESRRRVIFFCCICMLFYSGSTILYNQFLPTFLQSPPQNMTLQDSSLLHSLLNYAVSFGRALSIFIAMKVPPQAIIISNLSLFLIGTLLIYLFPMTYMLWIGNLIIGLSWSSVSAPLYSFLKQHMKVTSVTGSVFVFCNGLTSVVTPYFTAKLMYHDSSYLMVITMVTVLLSLIAFIGVYFTIFSLVKETVKEKSTESCELNEIKE